MFSRLRSYRDRGPHRHRYIALEFASRSCLPLHGWSFFAYIALRSLISPAPYTARADLYSVLATLTLYGLTVSALDTSARRIAFIVSLLAFGVVHVLVSVIQTGFGENLLVVSPLETVERSQRATGLYVNPDHLAGLLEVLGIFGLSLTCWSRWPSWAKVFVGYLSGDLLLRSHP